MAGRARRWLAAGFLFACLCWSAGCALSAPVDRTIIRSRVMRFDDRAADADLVGEVGGQFGGAGGLCGGGFG